MTTYLRKGDMLAVSQADMSGWTIEGPATVEQIIEHASGYDGELSVIRVLRIEADGVVNDVTAEWAATFAEHVTDNGTQDQSLGNPDYEWMAEEMEELCAGYEIASMRGLREMRADIRAAQERVL